jgi:hypothetical protein
LALPLLAPTVLLLSIGAPLAWRLMKGSGLPPLRRPSAVILALLLAGAYLCINATWSLSPSTARVSLVMLFLFIAAVHVTLQALEDGDPDAQRAMAGTLCGDGDRRRGDMYRGVQRAMAAAASDGDRAGAAPGPAAHGRGGRARDFVQPTCSTAASRR